MKAILINKPINTTTGIPIPMGAIVILNEATASIFNEQNILVPCQIPCSVYESVNDYVAGKQPLANIADFNTGFGDLMATSEQFEPIRQFLLAVVESRLVSIYGDANVEIITI